MQRPERIDAAFLGHAARDPIDGVVAGQRARGRVGVGGLAVVDVAHAADGRDQLLPVCQAREGHDAARGGIAAHVDGAHRGIGRGGVLTVVHAGQSARLGQVGHALGAVRHVIDQLAGLDIDAARRRVDARDGNGLDAVALRQRGTNGARMFVVDADDGRARAVEDRALGGDIACHAAVTIQMIGADVQQQRHVEDGRGRDLELVGRHLQHVDAVRAEGRQGQGGRAQIAAHGHLAARRFQDVAD